MKNEPGLVLEGGANRGVFTAGVLDCFQENQIWLPYVVAVSVGCCCAMDYVSRQPGRTKSCMIPEGRNPYPISWKHFFHCLSVVDFDLVFRKYPNGIVSFDYDSFNNSGCVCEYVVTNCKTGAPEYIREQQDGERMMKAARASCSMPYLCRMVQLDEELYLDGGISDSIPVRHAMDIGYGKNIVILTREKGYVKQDLSKKVKRLGRMMYHNYPEFLARMESRADRYNAELAWIEDLEEQGRALVIRPDEVNISGLSNDEDMLKRFYQQGYDIANRQMGKIRDFIRR